MRITFNKRTMNMNCGRRATLRRAAASLPATACSGEGA